MKVVFLGTGTSQGVPMIGCTCEVCRSLDYRDKRLRTSIYLEVNNTKIVIDTGPDFRQQMLRERITQLDAVLITHTHKDHIAGLDDVRAYNYLQQRSMPLYGTPVSLEQIKREFYYAFEESKYPGTPLIDLHPISDQPFKVGSMEVTPLPVMHLRMPVMGFRIGDFAYITDANSIPDSTYELLRGVDTLVLNALQKEAHVSHFTLAQALEQVTKINPRQTFFTHMSHRMGKHGEISSELPAGVALAYDGQVLSW